MMTASAGARNRERGLIRTPPAPLRKEDDSKSFGRGTSAAVPAAFENNTPRGHGLGELPPDSPAAAAGQQRGLIEYVRILRRRKWYVIATTILVAGLAVAFSLRQPKVYQAQSQVLLTRTDIASAITGTQDPALAEDPARYAETQAAIARSSAVAALALKTGHIVGLTPRGLLGDSSVTPSATADVLGFMVQDRDAARAARLVNAYAAAFVSYQLRLQTGALSRARAQLKQQLSRLAALGLGRSAAYHRLANNEQQLHTMQLLQSGDTVLTHPRAGAQVKPTPTRDGLLGLGFGLLIGLGLAFAAEALDRRVRTEDEVEQTLGLPLLARVPEPPRRRRAAGIAMLDAPRGAYAEAVRRLATSIVFSNPDRPSEMLMFTSALQQEGKSTTVANLGIALAAAGNRVVLVDLDLRRPALASLFQVHRLTGLTDVAVGRSELDKALVRVDLPVRDPRRLAADQSQTSLPGELHVLPTGPLPLSPGEFVASGALASRVLAPLREQADYVLVDSPPMCFVGDAARLSARMDAIVVVTRLGIANRSALRDLQRQLAAAPVAALGVVVAGVDLPAVDGYARYLQSGELPTRSQNGKGDRSRLSRRARL
jgi:capsular exopolysaccharide synthesis family protein